MKVPSKRRAAAGESLVTSIIGGENRVVHPSIEFNRALWPIQVT